MRLRDPLHLGAFFCGLAALFWGLSAFIGIAIVPAFLLGLAAGIMFLFPHLPTPDGKKRLRIAAAVLLAVHGVFIILLIITTPVNLGEDPDQGLNLDPPEWANQALVFYTTLFFVLAALILPLGVVMFSGTMERVLAAIGALAVIAVILLGATGVGSESEATGTLFRMLVLLGFVLIALACLKPAWQEKDAPWDRPTRSPRTS